MVVPFETLLSRQRRLDADRRRRCLRQFRAWPAAFAAGRLTVDELCARAGEALDAYAAGTAEALRCGNLEDRERATWTAREYHDGIGSVAEAIRDEIDDLSARHLVAQTLQERLLRAELRFRTAQDCQVAQRRRS